MSFKKFFFPFILLLALATRFVGINWGNGYYFHPDENNMAVALSKLTLSNFNPHFFAYGQFPLYLGFFSLNVLSVPNTFSASVLILRFWSALFSVLTILIIYLISRKLFSPGLSLVVALLTIFSPGLIQLAHFGTTESLLILAFLLNIYFAIKIYQQPKKYSFYIVSGIVTGISLATKISSLIFLGPILLVSLMNFIKSKQRFSFVPKILLLISFSLVFYLLSSPYNLLDKKDFLSSMSYETEVATGQTKVFYTTQFQKTTPFLFQIVHVFPYTSGIFQFIFAFIGLVFLIKTVKVNHKKYVYWFLILIPTLVYFLYFGQLYVKWTRFVSPIFFIFPLLSVVFISVFKNKIWQSILICLGCLPGLYFFTRLYFRPDIRLTASLWLTKNISSDSQVLSEGGNVVDIPISDHSFPVVNYDFYQYNVDSLVKEIVRSDYVLVPSRRVFRNYNYGYHLNLFNGSLGFTKIHQFNPFVDLFLNSENAEETWSVFDHPTIRIYKKNKPLTIEQYTSLLKL